MQLFAAGQGLMCVPWVGEEALLSSGGVSQGAPGGGVLITQTEVVTGGCPGYWTQEAGMRNPPEGREVAETRMRGGDHTYPNNGWRLFPQTKAAPPPPPQH